MANANKNYERKIKNHKAFLDLNEDKKESEGGRVRRGRRRGSSNRGSGRRGDAPSPCVPAAPACLLPAAAAACLPACLPLMLPGTSFFRSSLLFLFLSSSSSSSFWSATSSCSVHFSVARVAPDGHGRVIDNIAAPPPPPPPPVIAATEARPLPGPAMLVPPSGLYALEGLIFVHFPFS